MNAIADNSNGGLSDHALHALGAGRPAPSPGQVEWQKIADRMMEGVAANFNAAKVMTPQELCRLINLAERAHTFWLNCYDTDGILDVRDRRRRKPWTIPDEDE